MVWRFFTTVFLLLPNCFLAEESSLREILGRHYSRAFPEGWGRNCSYSQRCCEVKQAGEYFLSMRESLRPTTEAKTLGELQEDYDRLVLKIMLAEGLEAINEKERELVGHVAQAMKDSQNPLVFSRPVDRYGEGLREYFQCSPRVPLQSRPCELLSNADETAVKGFITIYKNLLKKSEEQISFTTEERQDLENQREITREKIIRIKAGSNYEEYSRIVDGRILPRILRDCEINQNDVTVNKICPKETPFGELKEFLGDVKKITAYLRQNAPRLNVEAEQKQLAELRVQRFLQSRKKGYYRGPQRRGKRPGSGELFAHALKESMPNISQTLMMGIFRPNHQALYNQAIYSKNQEYLYQLMVRQTPDFFHGLSGFALPCLPQFCNNKNPYFNPSLNYGGTLSTFSQ